MKYLTTYHKSFNGNVHYSFIERPLMSGWGGWAMIGNYEGEVISYLH